MNFETGQNVDDQHQAVRKPVAGQMNGEPGASESGQINLNIGGAGAGRASQRFPGMEDVENYSAEQIRPHVTTHMIIGNQESAEEGEGQLLEAWVASYPQKAKEVSRDGYLERIIGTDDRVLIRDTRPIPWKNICQLTIQAKNGRRYLGTGWLVSPRTLITAGHNLFLHNAGGWAQSITVTPGMNGTSTPFGSCQATDLRSVSGWVNSRTEDSDYGAIILPRDCRINMGNPQAYFQLAEATADLVRGMYLNISGYPGDKGGRTQWFHARPVGRLTNRRIYYDIDTMGGHSGSPVFFRHSSGARVAVGIHTYGGATENSGTRFIRPILDNLIRWRDEGR